MNLSEATSVFDSNAAQQALNNSALKEHERAIMAATQRVVSTLRHGDLSDWQKALTSLPAKHLVPHCNTQLNADTVSVEFEQELNDAHLHTLEESLQALMPWRKGPYRLGPCEIDTEWRSDWKWQRLIPHIESLSGKTVLDVGCGSGYHAWRMRGAGAATVLGLDPTLLFNAQFKAVQHFVDDNNVCLLPLKMEEFPADLHSFDTVFSMGVLYHRRDPEEHLRELKGALKPDGQLVLETLILNGDEDRVITPGLGSNDSGEPCPSKRYARMRNVWAIPTLTVLRQWLENCGFSEIQVVSNATTSIEEQRSTPWMPFESLSSALDPTDPSLTIEGWPAPQRAILVAKPAEVLSSF